MQAYLKFHVSQLQCKQMLVVHETTVALTLSLFCFLDPATPLFLLLKVAKVSLEHITGEYAGSVLPTLN